MFGSAPLSPASRGVANLEGKAALLEVYEEWGHPIKLDIPEIVGKKEWAAHLSNLAEIESAMRSAHEHSNSLRERLRASVAKSSTESKEEGEKKS